MAVPLDSCIIGLWHPPKNSKKFVFNGVRNANFWRKYETILPRKNLPIWDPNLPLRNTKSPYLALRKYHMYVYGMQVVIATEGFHPQPYSLWDAAYNEPSIISPAMDKFFLRWFLSVCMWEGEGRSWTGRFFFSCSATLRWWILGFHLGKVGWGKSSDIFIFAPLLSGGRSLKKRSRCFPFRHLLLKYIRLS